MKEQVIEQNKRNNGYYKDQIMYHIIMMDQL